jgi:beta-N-acetylhexosaminidase
MAKSLQSAGADFDLVYGWEYAGPVLDHIKTNNRQGLAAVYNMALSDPTACGIIRAKRPEDGALLGTVVLYNMQSQLAEFVPAMKDVGELAGGISSPVISPSVGEFSTLLQGLILLGMRQIKAQGCNVCILDYVSVRSIRRHSATLLTWSRWMAMAILTVSAQWGLVFCTISKKFHATQRLGLWFLHLD